MVPEITPTDAKVRFDAGDTTFVDIRDPGSFAEARVPGAVALTNDSAPAFLSETPKDTPLIVYCYHGNSSKQATAFLLSEGFTDVRSLSGGFETWRQSLPTES